MIETKLMRDDGILVINPVSELEIADFDRLNLLVNPYLEDNGKLNGILIFFEAFSGWENFAAMLKHIQFVDNHHEKVKRIAFITDSTAKSMLPKLADYFVAAEVRHFDFKDRDVAEKWLKSA